MPRHPRLTKGHEPPRAALGDDRRFQVIFEGSPNGLVVTRLTDGVVLERNRHMETITGYRNEEILGRSPMEADLAIWARPADRARMVRDLQTQGTTSIETVLRHRDGTLFPVLMSSTRVELAGEPCVVSAIRDLRDERRAEQRVRDSELRLRSLFEGAPIAMYRADLSGRLLQINAAEARVYGYDSIEQMLQEVNRTGVACLWEDPRDREAFMAEVLAVEGHYHQGEARLRRRDGSSMFASVLMMLTTDPKTGQPCVVGFVQDITQRKQYEAEIEGLRISLANIIDSMPAVLIGLDDGFTVTQWNRQAETFSGVPAQTALGQPLDGLLPEFFPSVAALSAEVARLQRSASLERMALERDGEGRLFDLMVYPLVGKTLPGVVVHINDVTERAHMQNLIIQAEKLMSVGGLAVGLAHEINNPLGIIIQAAQNIERRLSADLPANRQAADAAGLDLAALKDYYKQRAIPQFMESIHTSVGRAADIVARVLQLSRTPGSTRVPVRLREVVEQVLALAANDFDLKKRYDFKGVEVHCAFEPDLPLVPMVPSEIEHVIYNLVKNAVQALAANPPERPRRLTITVRRDPNQLVLELQDNGPGMGEAVCRRIFEPFFTTRPPGSGSGLGLSVAYMIVVKNHKGSLTVDTAPGKGACFTVTLPLAPEGNND